MTSTIISNTPSSIDWSKKQIVKSINLNLLVLVSEAQKDKFSGVVLLTDEPDLDSVGSFSDSWYKAAFESYPSPVTIEFEF